MNTKTINLLLLTITVMIWPVGEIAAQTYTPSTFAGGKSGFANGNRTEARFSSIDGLALDSDDNIYVSDSGNCIIRKITPTGQVTTLAGQLGRSGTDDGDSKSATISRFGGGLAVGKSGNIYISDSKWHVIRKITPTGEVTTLAGLLSSKGNNDGKGAEARFNRPDSIAVSGGENIYVVDSPNGKLCKITPTGVVTTLATLNVGGGHYVVAADNSDNVYIADTDTYTIRKIEQTGKIITLAGLQGFMGSTDGVGTAARFYTIDSITVDSMGNLYVSDRFISNAIPGKSIVRKVTPSGLVTTLIGVQGNHIAIDSKGNLYTANVGEIMLWKLKSEQDGNDKFVVRTTPDVAVDPAWKIPVAFSLRDEYDALDVVVKNQGSRGTCTIFGTLGVMEFHLAKKGEYVQLSEQFASWAANQISHTVGKREGYSAAAVMAGIKKYGITTEAMMPYNVHSVSVPSKAVLADAATRKNVGVTVFKQPPVDRSKFKPGFTQDEIQAICGALAEGLPVTAAVSWHYGEGARFDPGFIVRLSGSDTGGHVVVLVGYELSKKYPGDGCFIFRQSWGKDYGDKGYARLTFEYAKRHGLDAFAIRLF